MNNLAKNILYLRKLKGKRQDEMPDFIGIARATWSKYENGVTVPPLETLILIANKFKVTLDELVISDYESVHLNKNQENNETGENVHQNVHHQVHQNEVLGNKNELSLAAESVELTELSSKQEMIKAINQLRDELASMRSKSSK